MLTLYEKLFLLILDEEKGNTVWFAKKSFVYPMAGLMLAELALLGKLGVGEKLRLLVLDAEPVDDPILDDVLGQVRSAERGHKPGYWVSLLSEEPKKLRQNIAMRLVEKGILVQDEKRYFRRQMAPDEESPAPDKIKVKQELRSAVFLSGEVSPQELTLLEMIVAGGLSEVLFTRDEVEMAGRIIHKLLLTAALGTPTMQVVEEIGGAVRSIWEDEME